MLSCELVYLHVAFIVSVEFVLLGKWLGLELRVKVFDSGQIEVLFIYSNWFFLLVAELFCGHKVACVPWLETGDGVESSESSLIVNEADIDLLCSGNFARLITSRLGDRI